MNFIKLTASDKLCVWVNLDLVDCFYRREGKTWLHLGGGDGGIDWIVEETPEEIVEKLKTKKEERTR